MLNILSPLHRLLDESPVARRSSVANRRVSTYPKPRIAPGRRSRHGRSTSLLLAGGLDIAEVQPCSWQQVSTWQKCDITPRTRSQHTKIQPCSWKWGPLSRIDLAEFQCFHCANFQCVVAHQVSTGSNPPERNFVQGLVTVANGRKRSQTAANDRAHSIEPWRMGAHQ